MRPVAALAASILLGSTAFAEEPPASTAPAASPATVTATTLVMAAPAPVEAKMGREMNGHYFLPSHLIEDPFSYTAFAMTFGLGSGNALGP